MKNKYKATDYNFTITKYRVPNPNTGKLDFELRIEEFDVEFYFQKIPSEKLINSIIDGLIISRIECQKLPLPIPKHLKKRRSK
jgi:hypothetical protein